MIPRVIADPSPFRNRGIFKSFAARPDAHYIINRGAVGGRL